MDSPGHPPLRVFLADDHPVVLDGIKGLVLADPGLDFVGEARDGPTALRLALELRPDVAVLDISMPGMNGIDVARNLLADCPGCRILVLTVHEDAAYLGQLLDIGVAGYVLKRSATEELGRAIRAIASGGIYLDPSIAGAAIGRTARQTGYSAGDSGVDDLSQREHEVISLTAAGHSNKAIAAKLGIGLKSVDTYKARAMAKLGFETRVELIRFAVSRGWLASI